jgi:hypothetical protein
LPTTGRELWIPHKINRVREYWPVELLGRFLKISFENIHQALLMAPHEITLLNQLNVKVAPPSTSLRRSSRLPDYRERL